MRRKRHSHVREQQLVPTLFANAAARGASIRRLLGMQTEQDVARSEDFRRALLGGGGDEPAPLRIIGEGSKNCQRDGNRCTFVCSKRTSRESCMPSSKENENDNYKNCLWEPGEGQQAGKCLRKCSTIKTNTKLGQDQCDAMETCDHSQVGTVWNAAFNVFAKYSLYTNSGCTQLAKFNPGNVDVVDHEFNKEGGIPYADDGGAIWDAVAFEGCIPMPGGVAYKFTADGTKTSYIQYSDSKCEKPTSIQDVTWNTGCFKFQPFAKQQPLWFQLKGSKPYGANTIFVEEEAGLMIIDNKLFADDTFQTAYQETLGAYIKDTFWYPAAGGFLGYPTKFTVDSGITFRYMKQQSPWFKSENVTHWCHVQKGLSAAPTQPAIRGVSAVNNLAFYDDAAMWCLVAIYPPLYTDDTLDAIGLNRGSQPFVTYPTDLKRALDLETLDMKDYEKIRPFKCQAKCWMRTKHTCDDQGCYHDILTDKCMTRDSCQAIIKMQNSDGIWGETCQGKYKERYLVPPPPPMNFNNGYGGTAAGDSGGKFGGNFDDGQQNDYNG